MIKIWNHLSAGYSSTFIYLKDTLSPSPWCAAVSPLTWPFPHPERSCLHCVKHSCVLQRLTWARSLRPDMVRRRRLGQTVISRTAGWRGWCGEGLVSPAPVPFLRPLATTRVGVVVRSPCPLIWLLVWWSDKAETNGGLEKSADTGNLQRRAAKPLIKDRNRRRRSAEWFGEKSA